MYVLLFRIVEYFTCFETQICPHPAVIIFAHLIFALNLTQLCTWAFSREKIVGLKVNKGRSKHTHTALAADSSIFTLKDYINSASSTLILSSSGVQKWSNLNFSNDQQWAVENKMPMIHSHVVWTGTEWSQRDHSFIVSFIVVLPQQVQT